MHAMSPPSRRSDESPRDLAGQAAVEFAATRLGPASERLLSSPEAQRALRERLDAGMSMRDAVLAEVHAAMPRSRRLADEFLAHFLIDLMHMGHTSMAYSSKLRHFLDTGDLVMSVFGDVWSDFASLRFESEGQFKALFAQRLQWKAASRARSMDGPERGERRRVEAELSEIPVPGAEQGVLPDAIRREERERLILVLLRMTERERKLLGLHLKGLSIGAIAAELGLEYDAARKALQRAVSEARSLAARTDPPT